MAEEQPAPSLARRYGLERPLQGRYVAGVCAALGRATGTDPVLWRVVLAVLVCFLGTGALIYLVAWLLTPEEGDDSSPLEAMLGRGFSSTSPVLVVVLGVAAALLLVLILPRPLYLVLAGSTVLAILLLISRARSLSPPTGRPAGGAEPAPPVTTDPVTTSPVTTSPVTTSPVVPSVATGATIGAGVGAAGPAGYRPPFAPHGPFAAPPPSPPPRTPPRERSRLPALTFFGVLVVLGSLGVLDLTGALDIPASGYLAASLAVVGIGLLTGAWLGRARPLIALGVVLALALPVAHGVETVEPPENVGDLTWVPQSRAELADEYALSFGSGLVDLRQVDVSGQRVEIAVRISFGEMRVVVPESVAVEARVHHQFGGLTLLGRSRDEIPEGVVRDPGSGDPADGTLVLDLHVRFGNLEVHR
jgi:phage shock protein PspC (stress-responsive transcriptional regulator)